MKMSRGPKWEGCDGYHVFSALFAMVPRPRVSLRVHFTLVSAHSIRQLPSGFSGRLDYGSCFLVFFFGLGAYLLSECLQGRSVDGTTNINVYRCGITGRGRRARHS